MAEVSAPLRASMLAARPARNSSTAIQLLAMATSTTANWPNRVASTWYTSRIATMLAPPPIQLPASAAMPFHTSPATTSGQNHWNSWKATIAPRNRPKVAAQNTNSSRGPSLSTPFRSMVMVSRTRATGSSTRLPIGL
ncbi:hypothetical protein L613_005100000110 [Pseudoxanthomonas taiwanensis J19]|uniref:Uncharacterized protein n=1 Tax=Pseudoxanthomonas taiwanensis J19 TaxID=935569 RepID=A0A562D819_9GAMM|nr:hypothetical protein L613_005100000110 [Pseudoxanthomonas taiwanensis J19]